MNEKTMHGDAQAAGKQFLEELKHDIELRLSGRLQAKSYLIGKIDAALAAQPPAAPVETSDGAIYAAVSQRDMTHEEWVEFDAVINGAAEALPGSSAVTGEAVLDDIRAERRRQINVEVWTVDHDDTHDDGQLAKAAGCYALVAGFADINRRLWTGRNRDGEQTPWPNWPWSPSWWRPKDRRSDLVRAGALIVAEIERLDRAKQRASLKCEVCGAPDGQHHKDFDGFVCLTCSANWDAAVKEKSDATR